MNEFSEASHPSLDRIDPEGDRIQHLIHTPAIPKFMRANERFFFGSHDKAATHPGVIFKHPAHFANIKLSDFRSNELLYDADFEVAGHQIASDQKSIGGRIQQFPLLTHPFADERILKLTVEADNPMVEYPHEIFPATKPVFKVDPPQSVKLPTGMGKSAMSEKAVKTVDDSQASSHGPLSERLTDHWRKNEFVFSIKRPLIETEIPMSIRGLAEFI